MDKVRIWDYEAIAKGPDPDGYIKGVPDSAARPEETGEEWILRMLLKHLQTLAADTDTMLRAYPPECSAVDELVNDFNHYLQCSEGVVYEGIVAEGYFDKACLVDEQIGVLSDRRDPDLWTDTALRNTPEWAEIRRLAKEALAAMGYKLEPPPPGSM